MLVIMSLIMTLGYFFHTRLVSKHVKGPFDDFEHIFCCKNYEDANYFSNFGGEAAHIPQDQLAVYLDGLSIHKPNLAAVFFRYDIDESIVKSLVHIRAKATPQSMISYTFTDCDFSAQFIRHVHPNQAASYFGLSFSKCTCDAAWDDVFVRFGRLNEIHLAMMDLKDMNWNKIPDISILEISYSEIPEKIFSEFPKFKNLEHITLSGETIKITKEDIVALSLQPSLRSLQIKDCRTELEKADYEVLENQENIAYVNISYGGAVLYSKGSSEDIKIYKPSKEILKR